MLTRSGPRDFSEILQSRLRKLMSNDLEVSVKPQPAMQGDQANRVEEAIAC